MTSPFKAIIGGLASQTVFWLGRQRLSGDVEENKIPQPEAFHSDVKIFRNGSDSLPQCNPRIVRATF